MSYNVDITPGTGNIVAADEVTDGTLGTVKVQYMKLMDGTLGSTNKAVVDATGDIQVDVNNFPASQTVNGTVAVSNFPATQPVSGSVSVSNFPVTQPVSGTVAVSSVGGSVAVTGPLTDTQLRATPVPISGTVTSTPSGTQNVSITNAAGASAVNVQDGGNSLTVDGSVSVSNFPATQPVSGTVAATQSGTWTVQPGNTANTTAWKVDGSAVTQPISAVALPLPTGASTSANQTNGAQQTQIVQGGNTVVVDATGDLQVDVNNPVQVAAANLGVTATGASAAAVTATLPAVAGQFHYITGIEIVAYTILARSGSATPVLVTTTNLPGSNVWDFQSAAAIGTSERQLTATNSPIKSAVVNTATTIVCPATTSVIWRVNVYYFTAA